MPTRLIPTVPFDGAGVFRYLTDHAIPGLEHAGPTSYRRMLRAPDGTATPFEVRNDGASGVSLDAGPGLMNTAERTARDLLDLSADSAQIDSWLARDETLAPLIALRPGIRLPGSVDAHEDLFRTLIGQQVSVAAARTVLGRVVHELSGESGLFPTAQQFAERGREVLRGPTARINAIHRVAVALASGDLIIDSSLDVDGLTERLLAQPGIGPWTAGYVAMRVLKAPDVMLETDLVVLQGAARLGLPARPRELAAHAARWAPWRSYATLRLWQAGRLPD